MQCARAILSPAACPPVQQFSTLSHKLLDFRKNVIDHKMCVLIFSTTFLSNISHSEQNSARCDQNVCWSACKVPLLVSDFNKT